MSRSHCISERGFRFWRAGGQIDVYETVANLCLDGNLRSFLEPPNKLIDSWAEAIVKVTDQSRGRAEILWLRVPQGETRLSACARQALDTGVYEIVLLKALSISRETSAGLGLAGFCVAVVGRLTPRTQCREHERQEFCLRVLEVNPAHKLGPNHEMEPFVVRDTSEVGEFVRVLTTVTWSPAQSQGTPVTMALRPDMRGALIGSDSGEALIILGDLIDSRNITKMNMRVADYPLNFSEFLGDQNIVFGTETSLMMVRTADCVELGTEPMRKLQTPLNSGSIRQLPRAHALEERPCRAITVPTNSCPFTLRGNTVHQLPAFLVYRRDTGAHLFHLDFCFYLRTMDKDDTLYVESVPDGSPVQELLPSIERGQMEDLSITDRSPPAESGSRSPQSIHEDDPNIHVRTVLPLFGGRFVIFLEMRPRRFFVLRRKLWIEILRQAVAAERYALSMRLCCCPEAEEHRANTEFLELKSSAFNGLYQQLSTRIEQGVLIDEFFEDLCGSAPGLLAMLIANARDMKTLQSLVQRYERLGASFCPSGDRVTVLDPLESRCIHEKGAIEVPLHLSAPVIDYKTCRSSVRHDDVQQIRQSFVFKVSEETNADAHQEMHSHSMDNSAKCAEKRETGTFFSQHASHDGDVSCESIDAPDTQSVSRKWSRAESFAKHDRYMKDILELIDELRAGFAEDIGSDIQNQQMQAIIHRKVLDWLETHRVSERLADRPEMLLPLWRTIGRTLELKSVEKLQYLETIFRVESGSGLDGQNRNLEEIIELLNGLGNASNLVPALELAELYGAEIVMETIYRRLGLLDELAVFLQNRSNYNALLQLCLDCSSNDVHVWEHALMSLLQLDPTFMIDEECALESDNYEGKRDCNRKVNRGRHSLSLSEQAKLLPIIIRNLRRRHVLSAEALPLVAKRLWAMNQRSPKNQLSLPFHLEKLITEAIDQEEHTVMTALLSRHFALME
ncbi:hypothetical protein CCYA_CCYA02G0597 [Cyanidiococcus yangmingshanensis]|nr:hypothetical protein CCYA_CCYA02G0597 [Cyanidiococcus yangmingshanensis]